MKSCLIGGILGGLIIFLWSMVSWMVLPWHNTTLNGFKDEKSVSAVVVANVEKSGIYILPRQMETAAETATPQAAIFASVRLEGVKPMAGAMVISLLTEILAASLVACLVSKTNGLGYLRRVGFVVTFALAAAIIANAPYWNWWGFDMNYTLVSMADVLIGWFLAGLVIAKFATCCKK